MRAGKRPVWWEHLLIYLDYNASTPIAPEVAEAMRPFLADHYGNPSSGHWAGAPAKQAVEKARGQIAGFLGCLFYAFCTLVVSLRHSYGLGCPIT